MSSGCSIESLYLARMTPSHRTIARPSGWTSMRRAVKSVSGADEEAWSFSSTGPVTSISSCRVSPV